MCVQRIPVLVAVKRQAGTVESKDKIKAWMQFELLHEKNERRRRRIRCCMDIYDRSMRGVRLFYWEIHMKPVIMKKGQMSCMVDGTDQAPQYIPHFAGYTKKNGGFHWQMYSMITHGRALISHWRHLHHHAARTAARGRRHSETQSGPLFPLFLFIFLFLFLFPLFIAWFLSK